MASPWTTWLVYARTEGCGLPPTVFVHCRTGAEAQAAVDRAKAAVGHLLVEYAVFHSDRRIEGRDSRGLVTTGLAEFLALCDANSLR